MRQLRITTDGSAIGVEQCELSALEVRTVLEVLSSLLLEGQFPFPGGPPILEVVKPKESKKEK